MDEAIILSRSFAAENSSLEIAKRICSLLLNVTCYLFRNDAELL